MKLRLSQASVLFRFWAAFVFVALPISTAAATEAAESQTTLNEEYYESLKTVDHGKALMDWLRTTDGGFFHPKLELRKQGGDNDDTPFYGMYAIDTIAEGDVLLRIPRKMLMTPEEHYQVGDRVVREMDGESYHATIHKITEDDKGTYKYQLVYDDGEREDDMSENSFYPVSYQCKTVQRLVQEMKLGNDSEFAPYVNYLNSQPTGQLPSKWSQTGKDLLLEILGSLLSGAAAGDDDDENTAPQGVLPPSDPLNKVEDYHEDCKSFDNFHEDAYLLLEQRGWDDVMIPVFDMMSHGNGHWLNTRTLGSVHEEAEPVTVLASRDIAAGEEIYTTYNFCEDCPNRHLWYGTPELLRDYGFVEKYPQRWVFPNYDNHEHTIFDIDQVVNNTADADDGSPNTGELKLTWVEDYKLTSTNAPFFTGQLQRLQDLGETLFASKDPNVPVHEWQVLSEFREAYVTAIRMALEEAGYAGNNAGNNNDQTCTEEGSCVLTSSRYDTTLDQQRTEVWVKERPITCNDYKVFGVAFWEELEVMKSPYQKIIYLENPTFDPPDTCLMLDTVWQICTSYRPHYHEMSVHYTARFLKTVERVLFVGGGDSMLLHDVLQYPTLKKVIGLEIDQLVTRSAFKHFGVQPHFDNDKVEWWFGDAAKSMLMLPTELYGTFDMVLVDLSETVVALSVTKELDVLEALSLLIKPDGILLKNEYLYFPEQRNIFRDALHIHYYNVPAVCSQSLILGSNGIDFLRGDFKDHGVSHLYHWLDKPHVRYEVARDYQKNNTNPQTYCIKSENYEKEPTVQELSPGITMIVEAEQATATPKSSDAVKQMVEGALKEQGFSVQSTVVSDLTELPVAVTILREGYVVTRAWPEHKYCGYDIHLWSSFGKHEDAKKALITAVGSAVSGPSSSSYRIVSGGMFGVNTWKEDAKSRGPKLDECKDAAVDGSTAAVARVEVDESAVLTSVVESMSFVRDESKFAVAVVCGQKDKPCQSIDALKMASPVTDVIALHSCPDLVSNVEFMKDSAARMLACEKATWKFLQSNVADRKQKIRAIVVDSSAENAFLSVFQSICMSRVNKNRFLAENMTVVAPVLNDGKTLRHNFVDSFRKEIFPLEPSFKSEVYLNTTADGTVFEISIASSGDILFFEHLVQFVEQVENKTGLVGEINNVRGGDFIMQEPFEADQVFTDSDFEQVSPLKQWETQQPLGLQTLIQLGANDRRKRALDSRVIKTALKVVLARLLEQENNVAVKEFTEVGDGCVLVSLWSEGHVIVLWDGRDHIDINLFTYKEDFEFSSKFEKYFIDEIPGLNLALRDIQPRGTGHVVNFAKDLKDTARPRWV